MLIQQKTKKQQPCGGERSNAAARTAVCRRGSVTRAPRSRARLIPVTISRDSWRSHVHRTYTAQRVQFFELQTCNVGGRGERPSPFSGGSKGGILFGKRMPPLPRAAPAGAAFPAPRKGESKRDTLFGKRIPPLICLPFGAQKKSRPMDGSHFCSISQCG